MKVLLLHNYYQQKGGEDEIFATEADMLESRGHQVIRHTVHNDAVTGMNPLRAAANTVWNSQAYEDLRALVRRERPDVAHFHNTFPLISPAGYHAVRDEGVPVVQTLHNYRLLCPKAIFFRDGKVCEDCLGKKVPWPGVVHRCYRDSLAASAAVGAMLTTHNFLHTYRDAVSVFITYSRFTRQKFLQAGFPEEKLAFKTNCLHPAPAPGSGGGDYGLFVGRLTPEKGVLTLLDAWSKLVGQPGQPPLKIVGDGPLKEQVAERASRTPGVEFLGRRPLPEVLDLMGEARFLVVPSEWYETFGRVVIESFAKGTPVVVSNLGAVGELVDHGRTGRHFRPGDADDLAEQVRWLTERSELRDPMRRAVRAEFEAHYTADGNYETLLSIYKGVMAA